MSEDQRPGAAPEPVPEPAPDLVPAASEADLRLLDVATDQLRRLTDRRWVEVSDRVLRRVLATTRPSLPVRADGPLGVIRVSSQVIVSHLREALDGVVPGTAVRAIHLSLDGQDVFAGVVVDLLVQQGTEVLPAADQLHALAVAVLHDLLGPDAVDVVVRPTHVHVGDVTPDDPQTSPG